MGRGNRYAAHGARRREMLTRRTDHGPRTMGHGARTMGHGVRMSIFIPAVGFRDHGEGGREQDSLSGTGRRQKRTPRIGGAL